MKKILITFFILLIAAGLYSEDERGLQIAVNNLGGTSTVGKQYLILIAIDSYEHWFPLKHPVQDAKEVREILTSRYYIDEVVELYNDNATKANILKLFNKYKNIIKIEDSLLIFYAGHGHLDKNTNTGFWIPVNGGTDIYEQANWLPNTQIRGMLSNIKASHICLISDSCFSGDILNSFRSMAPEITDDYFKKAYERTSRQVLTSGASETVPDKSEFARQLKMALEKNNNPYLDPIMLYNEIRLGVGGTLPLIGSLKSTGHQEGASFLLFLKTDKASDNAGLTEKNRDKKMDFTIIKNYGNIMISVITGGKLYIDDEYTTDIPDGSSIKIDKIEAGIHEFKILYKVGNTEEKEIRVEKDSMAEVSFTWKAKLPSDAASFGYIEVSAASKGELFIDDKHIKNIYEPGKYKLDKIETGTHKIEMKYDYGDAEIKAVIVEKNMTAKVNFYTFIDNFDKETLSGRWTWKRQKKSSWSLSKKPGWLTIKTDEGELWEKSNNQKNLLFLEPEYDNFTIETRLELYPTQNFQQAGLIIYGSDDNYIRLNREYAEKSNISFIKEVKAVPERHGVTFIKNFIYLRIVKKENIYIGYFSSDGINYKILNQYYVDLGDKIKVGLNANKSIHFPVANTIEGYFEYFKISYDE